MIVWGGFNGSGYLNTGGAVRPGRQTPGRRRRQPARRRHASYHTAVWTGSKMIVWGGFNGSIYLNDRRRVRPGREHLERNDDNGCAVACSTQRFCDRLEDDRLGRGRQQRLPERRRSVDPGVALREELKRGMSLALALALLLAAPPLSLAERVEGTRSALAGPRTLRHRRHEAIRRTLSALRLRAEPPSPAGPGARPLAGVRDGGHSRTPSRPSTSGSRRRPAPPTSGRRSSRPWEATAG